MGHDRDKQLAATALTLIACAWPGQARAVGPDPASGNVVISGPVDDITDLGLKDLLSAPIVESASRRRQSADEAPGAISVIEASELEAMGVVSLADVLGRVPGLLVTRLDANYFTVGLRGVEGMGNGGVLVLLNGRRLFNISNATPTWSQMPVHPGEIERIEVLRGPSGPMYGADALTGVVNIVTKRAKDRQGVEGVVTDGIAYLPDVAGDTAGAQMNQFGVGYLAFGHLSPRGRLGVRGSFGFRSVPEWAPRPAQNRTYWGQMGYHAGLTVDVRPKADQSLFADLRHVMTEADESFSPQSAPQTTRTSEQSLALGFEQRRFLADRLTLRVGADVRRILVSSATVSSGEVGGIRPTNLTGHTNLQLDVATLDGRNIVTVGADAELRRTDDFFAVSPRSRYLAAVLQDELAVLDRRLVVSAAGRFERIDSTNGEGVDVVYQNLYPRASAIVRLAKEHSLRATAATAFRTPTLFENFVDIRPGGPPAGAPPPAVVIGNPSLRPERMRSYELGYRGRLFSWMRAEVTGYSAHAHDMIEQAVRTALPLQAENAIDSDIVGVEVGADVRPAESVSGYAHYTFTHIEENGLRAGRRWPTHLAAVGGALALPASLALNADLFVASSIAPRLVLVTEGPTLSEFHAEGHVRATLNLRLARRVNETLSAFLGGTNLLGFVRERSDLAEHPMPQAAPIGATVFIGLEVMP